MFFKPKFGKIKTDEAVRKPGRSWRPDRFETELTTAWRRLAVFQLPVIERLSNRFFETRFDIIGANFEQQDFFGNQNEVF
jgi:hypothetical protein